MNPTISPAADQRPPTPTKRSPIRLVDVARAAGVSVATVSRVLNGHAAVDPVLTERVRDAVRTLGYRPNAVARNLRRQGTQVWAVLVTDVTNPFFTSLLRGVEDIASESGYSVLLGNSDEDRHKEERYLQVAETERVAGLILTPQTPATDVSRLRAAGIPIVSVDRPVCASESDGDCEASTDTVGTDSAAGAALATEHLIDHGWRRIACISGPDDTVTGVRRAAGYTTAVRAAGREALVRHTDFSTEGGLVAARELLASDDPPDAFFVANAALSLGVLTAIRSAGHRLGHDIGVVGYDDAPWAPLLDAPLTVMAQPAYDIGVTAARLLLDRLRGDATEQPCELVLPTTLIERASCRRAPG